jgi:hypothetical protein
MQFSCNQSVYSAGHGLDKSLSRGDLSNMQSRIQGSALNNRSAPHAASFSTG